MKNNNITLVSHRYTKKSDEEMRPIIKAITTKFPNSGIREVVALLKTQTPPIIIQRDRVQQLLSTINPLGAARRWAQVIPRRKYNVTRVGPQDLSLIHI